MQVSHTYTVVEKRRTLHWDGKGENPSVKLRLDNQKSLAILGWGSLPYSIDLHGDELCRDLDLGSKVKLTLEIDGE